MDIFTLNLDEQINWLVETLESLPTDDKIEAINRIKLALHKASPFRAEPVDCVLWVKADQVQANDYNPNKVAPPEMRLLEQSIKADGYTQPIVAVPDKQEDREFTVVDGFHRIRIGKECKIVRERIKGYLPVVAIRESQSTLKDRIAATIRHNRARGKHGIDSMTDIVATLIREGSSDSDICKQVGMDADELLRFKQNSGLPELFKENRYSMSWK
jgi:ParB-like chromosome segregation protein Spo0J